MRRPFYVAVMPIIVFLKDQDIETEVSEGLNSAAITDGRIVFVHPPEQLLNAGSTEMVKFVAWVEDTHTHPFNEINLTK